jgi:hypothetical protein
LKQEWIPCHSRAGLPARTPKKFQSTLRGDMVGQEAALEL